MTDGSPGDALSQLRAKDDHIRALEAENKSLKSEHDSGFRLADKAEAELVFEKSEKERVAKLLSQAYERAGKAEARVRELSDVVEAFLREDSGDVFPELRQIAFAKLREAKA